MKDISTDELKSRLAPASSKPDNCPICSYNGWHMSWCPNGPGDSHRLEAGVGHGRKLMTFEEERQAEAIALQKEKANAAASDRPVTP